MLRDCNVLPVACVRKLTNRWQLILDTGGVNPGATIARSGCGEGGSGECLDRKGPRRGRGECVSRPAADGERVAVSKGSCQLLVYHF